MLIIYREKKYKLYCMYLKIDKFIKLTNFFLCKKNKNRLFIKMNFLQLFNLKSSTNVQHIYWFFGTKNVKTVLFSKGSAVIEMHSRKSVVFALKHNQGRLLLGKKVHLKKFTSFSSKRKKRLQAKKHVTIKKNLIKKELDTEEELNLEMVQLSISENNTKESS